jgi:hypothetical protein
VAGAHVYDATNPEARDIYWEHLPGKLLAQGWDAFWLDSAEPEEYWPHMGDAILSSRQLAIGNGAEFTNVFPLVHTLGVQDHWKAQNPSKRVFLLTRSAFLGQQRVGATVWSGDVYGTYWGLSHQVPAGLNFALSGAPYWTTDIGGYWPPHEDPLADPAFQELYARWFEYGTFCPIFRTHGHRPHNELWSFDKVEPILVSYDKLRYRLMPYIYSLAWKVTSEDYTIQRPLVMDWRTDPKTWNLGDEFMFGPAILVNPVLKANATRRSVYLPAAACVVRLLDRQIAQGRPGHRSRCASRSHAALRARGFHRPMGPQIEYAAQDPAGPIELRIYRGADGKFDLYEDAGDGYEYEKGEHAVIPFAGTITPVLTIGARQGSFPGSSNTAEFRVVLVADGHGVGAEVTGSANAESATKARKLRQPSSNLRLRRTSQRLVRAALTLLRGKEGWIMTHCKLSLLLAAVLCAPLGAQSQSADPCAALAGLKIDGVEITKAALVPAGTTVPPPYPGAQGIGPLPAHCRVDGIINRRKGVDGPGIRHRLCSCSCPSPAAWNGDFMMQGGGGGNGIVAYPAGANYAGDKPALSRGFAVASTDTGHKAKTGAFDFSFMRDQQAYLDFAFLANAEVAGVAKQIIATITQTRGVLLLRRLLHWRARRHDSFAALSHGLQRHRFRRPSHAHRPFQSCHRPMDPRCL